MLAVGSGRVIRIDHVDVLHGLAGGYIAGVSAGVSNVGHRWGHHLVKTQTLLTCGGALRQFNKYIYKLYIFLTVHKMLLLRVELLVLRVLCLLWLCAVCVCKIGGNWTVRVGHRLLLLRVGLGWRHHL